MKRTMEWARCWPPSTEGRTEVYFLFCGNKKILKELTATIQKNGLNTYSALILFQFSSIQFNMNQDVSVEHFPNKMPGIWE